MRTKYKAVLYQKTIKIAFSPDRRSGMVSDGEGMAGIPVDSILLNERCLKKAEMAFFTKNAWKGEDKEGFYIEIEDVPRIIA